METVSGVEGNDEGKFEESGVQKSCSAFPSRKQIGNPIVYKLVRVEGDGRLVPATDDEIMEVKDLLEDEKSEMHVVRDSGQTVGCIFNEGSSSGRPQLECSEGLPQSENTEADAEKLNARLEETVTSLAPNSNGSHANQPRSVGECLDPPDGLREGGSSTSVVCTSSKPDFSKLKGEICLDNLSIKELHETFKATFGRETTVKDKQWLKRRIAMGLTNSCDVSTTSFVIKDNKLVKIGKEESCNNADGARAKDPTDGTRNDMCKDSPADSGNQMEDHQSVSGKRLRNHSIDDDHGSEDLHANQTAAKRVRKPTRRYIEELSEAELKDQCGKLTSARNSGLGLLTPKSHVRPVRSISSDGRTVLTRLESLGGSGIHVPCVSRIRRSRPRENIMALMKFHPSCMGTKATLVKDAHGLHGSQSNSENGNRVFKAKSASEQMQQSFVAEPEKKKQFSLIGTVEVGPNVGLKHAHSSGDTSDDNVVTVPTAKGGIRRKHHRAWTLSEVMKLVEGVSRFGAGRWSEIKRLAFASYSYRTSVDLKDKWRNLLKASFAQTPSDKGLNSRKHASMPIPAPILLRVRELAEMQGPNLSSSNLAGCGGSSVHESETRSGYL